MNWFRDDTQQVKRRVHFNYEMKKTKQTGNGSRAMVIYAHKQRHAILDSFRGNWKINKTR